jgi:hypothetical protein
MSYHCQAIEKLTPLLESLSKIEEISIIDDSPQS